MQTGEYHGFAGQFPDWVRTQAAVWRGPLLISILVHVCLFWPKSLSQSDVGAPLKIGQEGLHARLILPSSPAEPVAPVTQPTVVRHVTVTETPFGRPLPSVIEASRAAVPSIPSSTMIVSSRLDASAQRSYRIALARTLMAGDLRSALSNSSASGELEIGVALTASGQLRDVAVLRGSGSSALDAVVVAAVRQAAQSAPIPAAMQGRDFVIALPVEVGGAAEPTSVAGR